MDYPLASGTLIRRTHPTGRTEWEVRATATSAYNLTHDTLHNLYIVARDGQSYVGTAWLREQRVRDGIRWSHFFAGTGELALGAKL